MNETASQTKGTEEMFRMALLAKNRLQDYVGSWMAVGCSCNNCATCDDRYLRPEEAERIAQIIEFLSLHAGALEHQIQHLRNSQEAAASGEYVNVPRVLTPAMIEAATFAPCAPGREYSPTWQDAWTAMIAARPEPADG